MKWVRRIIAAICSIALLVYLISLLFDKDIVSAYSLTLPARKEVVFNHLNDLSKWPDWTAWNMHDTSVQVKYGSITKGEGASLKWENMDDRGKVVITRSMSDSLISADIVLNGWSTTHSLMTLSATDSGTLVNWQMKTRLRNPISRIMGYFIKGWMLRDIKRGLRGLNVWLMNQGLTEGKILSLEYVENSGKTYYSLIITDTLSNLPSDTIRQAYFTRIENEIRDWKLERAHDPFIHIRKWPADAFPIIIDFCITVKDIGGYQGHYKVVQHQTSLISARFAGAMHQWKSAIDSIHQYASQLGKETESDPYVTFSRSPLETGMYKGLYPFIITLFVKETD